MRRHAELPETPLEEQQLAQEQPQEIVQAGTAAEAAQEDDRSPQADDHTSRNQPVEPVELVALDVLLVRREREGHFEQETSITNILGPTREREELEEQDGPEDEAILDGLIARLAQCAEQARALLEDPAG
jgi:hypothetical protein